ncbi:hypothetical protein GC175_11375 [bacterium]|nr:hypothetical protein [bacterium]
MSPNRYIRIVLICLFLLSVSAWPLSAHVQSSPNLITWQIVESTPDSLRVDIYIHDDAPNGEGVLLGVPSVDGISLHVTAHQMRTLPPAVVPTPTQPAPAPPAPVDNLWDNPEFIAPGIPPRADAATPIEIAESGLLRDQPFVLLRVYPQIYDPIKDQHRVYSFLQVELRWQNNGNPKTGDRRAAGGPFETVLAQTLLNYADLGRPYKPVEPGNSIDIGLAYWPAPKFSVTEDGLYHVTYEDLIAAGAEFETVDVTHLHLTLDGVEQPIWFNNGGDGRLDSGEWLRFYGYGHNDLYTDANVYVLNYDEGGDPGLRMPVRALAPNAAAPLGTDFPATQQFEVNNYYWQTMPNGAGQDHWFWDGPINANQWFTVTVDTPNLAPTPHDVTLQVLLRGRTTAEVTPNHHTRLYLNNVLIDDQLWAGQIPFTHTVTLSSTLLSAADNTLRLHNVGDTGADADIVFLNYVVLDYRRTFTATDDLLEMTPQPGVHQFAVGPFSDDVLTLLDISDPAAPVRLTGAGIVNVASADATSAYTLTFADDVQPGARYLALADTAVRRPVSITIDDKTGWRSPFNSADSILITHADFITPTRRLADFQRSRGLRAVVVNVEDIYDEFSYSRFTPAAIRDFLAYAYANWQEPAPTYVTLVGDATIDYRNYLNSGARNFVPTALTQTAILGDTPSDNWFVAVSGNDPLPDLLIGRISVDTLAQADAVIDAIINYTAPVEPAVGRGMLMVSDDDSPIFRTNNQQLADTLPAGMVVDEIDAANFPPGDPQTAIKDALMQGRAIVHYSGHGSPTAWGTWADSRILTGADVAALVTGAPFSLVTVANCVNGFFAGRGDQVSMAEAFQRNPNSGAIAVWAPTGFSYPAGHQELMKSFYATLLADGAPGPTNSLGAAAAAAKITVYTQGVFWTELVETYTLFGDPSQRLVLPAYPIQNYLPQVQGND